MRFELAGNPEEKKRKEKPPVHVVIIRRLYSTQVVGLFHIQPPPEKSPKTRNGGVGDKAKRTSHIWKLKLLHGRSRLRIEEE